MGEGDVERMLGSHQMLHAADNYGEIGFDPDAEPFRFQLFPEGERYQLNNTLSCRLGRPAWRVDRINRRPNGEINMNSIRELAQDSILEWTQLQTHTCGRQEIEVQAVSDAPGQRIKYQADFSFTNNGSTEYFVLRILHISGNRWRSTIQKKASPATIPFGVSTTDPSTIYLRDVSVNETLYRERLLKIQRF